MTTLPGRWALTMRTPIGTIEAEMSFTEHDDGTLEGVAASRAETVPLTDVRSSTTGDGEHVTWHQAITRPLRLNLAFDVVVQGDSMQGHSRAGRLPRSAVTGTRLPISDADAPQR